MSQNNTARSSGGILAGLRQTVAAEMPKTEGASTDSDTAGRRKPSDFWLNIGVTLPGAGEPDADGNPTDLFVSLPVGLALDDMKHVAIRGNNENWQQLGQTKNALLDALRAAAADLQPGERVSVDALSVELYRRADPAQTADASSNPMIAGLFKVLQGGKPG